MASESGVVELTNCKGCLKNKISLLKHLSKVPECKSIYTEEELSELKKEAKAKSKKKEKAWKDEHKDHVSAQNAKHYQTKIKSKQPPKDLGKYYSVEDVIEQAENWPDEEIDWTLSVQCRECKKMFKSTGIHMHMTQGALCNKKYSKDEVERVGFRTYLGTKEKEKQWLEENKQKIADQKKKWYQENKEKVAETKKKWYQKNKSEIAQKKAIEYEQHKDFYRYQKANYYEKNKIDIKKKNAAYYQLNKSKIAQKKKERQKEAMTLVGTKRKTLIEVIEQYKYDVKRSKKKDKEDMENVAKVVPTDYSDGLLGRFKKDFERFKTICKSDAMKMKIECIEKAFRLDIEETIKEINLEIHFVEIELEEIVGQFLEEFGQEIYLYTKSVKAETVDNIDFKMAKEADRHFHFQIKSNLRKFVDHELYLLRQHWKKELVPLATELGDDNFDKQFIAKIDYNENDIELRREHAKTYVEKKKEIRKTHTEDIIKARNVDKPNRLQPLPQGFRFC